MAISHQPMPPSPTLTRRRVGQLVGVHILVIAAANYAVQFSGSIMNYHFTYGMFIFPLAILATDLTVRLANPHQARTIVTRAYLPAILISTWLADWRIGLASGTAYLLGQWLDITVFQRVRIHLQAWWVAPLLSTGVANSIDTYTFYAAAFYHSNDPFLATHWPALAHIDLGFKIIVGIIFFLPAYGLLLNYLLPHTK